jgi:flagellar hook assembly protein FlgD
VDLHLVDATGRHVRALASGHHAAGEHRIIWDGANDRGQRVARGVYFATIRAGSFRASQRLVMTR